MRAPAALRMTFSAGQIGLKEYNDSNVMRFIETVTIHPDKNTVKFKAGLEI